MDTLGPANFTVLEKSSSLRGKIVLPRACPLLSGVLYLECLMFIFHYVTVYV